MTDEEVHVLHALLQAQPVAAVATLHAGLPAVSMAPFAVCGTAWVVHVSRLASHTQDMLQQPVAGLLVTAPASMADTPLALPRLSLQGKVVVCGPGHPRHAEARNAYLARLPESEALFSFSDFMLMLIEPDSARFIAGFGRAMNLSSAQLAEVLRRV
nr:pyridoxamine 5'-phosphate oxidase family protein [Andreprevotia lacus]